jgi:hypothetical protein
MTIGGAGAQGAFYAHMIKAMLKRIKEQRTYFICEYWGS